MFGSKFRSWMEAVRPRKKQHRKDKQSKSNLNNANNTLSSPNWQNSAICRSSDNDVSIANANKRHQMSNSNTKAQTSQSTGGAPSNSSRYSANNLSSPESAYSTGYSTDGTSPGAPPDYYINVKTEGNKYPTNQNFRCMQQNQQLLNGKSHPSKHSLTCTSPHISAVALHQNALKSPMQTQEVEMRIHQPRTPPTYPGSSTGVPTNRLNEVLGSPILTSPRQRNRIRTNPWVPSSTLSPGQVRQEIPKIVAINSITNSPISPRFLSPSVIRNTIQNRSLSSSSSSCSSLSGNSIHWELKRKNVSGSEEDDCTLNEMMGKYDESYVYEKETDILSDSEPTDCDTDIDTGQDGGDEDDPLEREFDFIDNGSYLELDPKEDRNTGHCIYYNFDIQKRTSRRRTTRRSKQPSDRRRRSSSNKKRHKQVQNIQLDGTKSAGATPLSVRRTKNYPISKLALEDCLKKRSNSVSFSRDPITTIDKRDKEADRKYKELIVEAEHILKSMKTNGLSPRRVPGPTNKRVEILRSAECAKPELFIKNRLMDELSTQISKIPSNNFSCPRFSPKKNHITNFINNNSPVLLRRENELPTSPLVSNKRNEEFSRNYKIDSNNRRSPNYRKKNNKVKLQECSSTSSDSETEELSRRKQGTRVNLNFGCPQSEPVRRKVYMGQEKTVLFNLNNQEIVTYNKSPPFSPTYFEINKGYKFSTENLRQQVLLNTIANLKRNLEDQSASLKQVVRSSQNIHH